MLRSLFIALAVLSLLIHPSSAFEMSNTDYRLANAAISGGGGISTNASYNLDMTLGQPVAGYATNTAYRAYLGRIWDIISAVLPSMETGVKVETTRISMFLGTTEKIFISVSNGGSATKTFPIHIGSTDQSENWAWFVGHRTDELRQDINITLGPYEKRVVVIEFFGAMPGEYLLSIGPDNTFANRYDDVTLNVVYRGRGLFSTTPDISAFYAALAVLAASAISASSGRKSSRSLRRH